jgi:hypothetical protein
MEAEIKKFLLGNEKRSEYGYEGEYVDGIGYGDGTGYGYGHECEYADGIGYGDGSGYGCGLGTDGAGNGSGSGFGTNDTVGFKCGLGNGIARGVNTGAGDKYGGGIGYGDGTGYGYGLGSDGTGNGSGNGFGGGNGNQVSIHYVVIKQFKGNKVYYVDDIPCIFKSVHENYASVEVINILSLELTKAFIGKYKNYFAHGETIRDAIEDARSKYYQSLDFDEVKEKLLAEFKKKGKLTVKELYDWHGMLTGSCRFGRTQFQTAHNLKNTDLLTLEEFINLTKNEFGGDLIIKLK